MKDIIECKKFISDFVKEVVLPKYHIEVTFNVVFFLLKNREEEIEVISSIKAIYFGLKVEC
ncbi:hypothetical protein CF078_14350 [Clostridium botulinum]|uniref:hypothetical protein n=1 Tax=Clostridium botulinum TaxID=1491 RepID=UPI000947611C|nr:hypothetical protein [Clostridium botulinum]APQ75453.1 hypothetical protein RSJ10_430 [Clostridium botulinum]MBN3355474.1 hypothetical protein [Clostridium botulinum]QDY27542.1 hypothetical protein CGQ41_01435 [Clostridium botulinum]